MVDSVNIGSPSFEQRCKPIRRIANGFETAGFMDLTTHRYAQDANEHGSLPGRVGRVQEGQPEPALVPLYCGDYLAIGGELQHCQTASNPTNTDRLINEVSDLDDCDLFHIPVLHQKADVRLLVSRLMLML